MKLTVKLFLAVILFCSVVFADGEMPSGGKSCTGNCLVAPLPGEDETKPAENDGSILILVKEYVNSVLEYFEN